MAKNAVANHKKIGWRNLHHEGASGTNHLRTRSDAAM
jgi:hypothetical protein